MRSIKIKALAFFIMCKPRVNLLITFTAIVGMFLATEGLPPLDILFYATIGIALVAFAAAAVNCVIEYKLDALMIRTSTRPIPRGEVGSIETLIVATILGISGLLILYFKINILVMWLTLATFFGYAIIYTVLLKPATPMNIVIGGASGAMPPVLGWSAISGEITTQALVLFLIIFLWTPPHFWALACYRREEYAKAKQPMLPVTHGLSYTALQILLYSFLLVAVSYIPFLIGMSKYFYLIATSFLNIYQVVYALKLFRNYNDGLAKKLFNFSLIYLSLLFTFLFIDRLF